MIPHGDRRNRAISSRAKNQEQFVSPTANNIVRIFVLRDGLNKQSGRLLFCAPSGEFQQRAE